MQLKEPLWDESAIINYAIDPILRCNHNLISCPKNGIEGKSNCKQSYLRHIISNLNDGRQEVICMVGPYNDSGQARDDWAKHIINCLNDNLNLIS